MTNDFVFPYTPANGEVGGLTKREFFAAMAMQGFIAGMTSEVRADLIAKICVPYADALIAELTYTELKKQPKPDEPQLRNEHIVKF